jgi:flagellar motor switch protein FliN/FliY
MENDEVVGNEQNKLPENSSEDSSSNSPVNKKGADDLDVLNDVPLHVSVQLGQTNIILKEVLQLGEGSVIELEKLAGEPLEVLINDKLVSRGEVVVINEKYGIRLTDIISPLDDGSDFEAGGSGGDGEASLY